MQKIHIEIPDNLTPVEEYNLLVRKLSKNLLPSGIKLIGSKYELQHLDTQINIKRVPTEDVLATFECSVCNTISELNNAYKLEINYGGVKKHRCYCSSECRDAVYNICGKGRARKIRKYNKK